MTMFRRLVAGLAAGATLIGMLVIATSSASASPTALLLPQANAFAILGHSCGGIQEQVFATGFDPTSGYPVGDVYMKTSCGGSGRDGGGHTTTYSAWAGVTWDYTGTLVADSVLVGTASVDPTLTVYDTYGNELQNISNEAFLTLASTFSPPPRIMSISASEGPAAGGTSLTITGTGFTGATAVGFGGSQFSGITVTGDTTITLTTPPSPAGTVYVTVIGPGGESTQSVSFRFTFVAVPTVSNLSPNFGPVSGGNQITITGTNFTYASAVNFGDQGAGFVVNGDTSITAYVPASDCGCQSDSASVTVSSVGGTSAPVTYGYTNVAPGTPDAPTIGTATAGNGSATVAFIPPVNDGGSTITSYRVTASDNTTPANGGQSVSGSSSPITVIGLTNGDSYTFTVAATNANGTGLASAASNAVVPVSSGPAPLSVTTTSIPDATRGVFYSTQLQASGGRAPYKWKNVGALPKGLKLHGDGILSGTPSLKVLGAGMYAITVKVVSKPKGKPPQVATQVLTLTIS
jgi:hypothetical protein